VVKYSDWGQLYVILVNTDVLFPICMAFILGGGEHVISEKMKGEYILCLYNIKALSNS